MLEFIEGVSIIAGCCMAFVAITGYLKSNAEKKQKQEDCCCEDESSL